MNLEMGSRKLGSMLPYYFRQSRYRIRYATTIFPFPFHLRDLFHPFRVIRSPNNRKRIHP
jgi:hypothetical protein